MSSNASNGNVISSSKASNSNIAPAEATQATSRKHHRDRLFIPPRDLLPHPEMGPVRPTRKDYVEAEISRRVQQAKGEGRSTTRAREALQYQRDLTAWADKVLKGQVQGPQISEIWTILNCVHDIRQQETKEELDKRMQQRSASCKNGQASTAEKTLSAIRARGRFTGGGNLVSGCKEEESIVSHNVTEERMKA
ncbi:MAG: hypothetical protein M1820_000248 [Bogoriella megaspora]|nr:MAG: hypothetical protein M1820_000248 [Bogoriella megaspora]